MNAYRKVELDLLEIDVPQEKGALDEKAVPKRKFSRKWVLVSFFTFLLLCVTGTSVRVYVKMQDVPVPFSKGGGQDVGVHRGETAEGVWSLDENVERFDDFVIDLRDEQGNHRLLICNVTLGLSKDIKVSENRVEVRRIIYKTAKKIKIAQVTSVDAKKGLKKTIRSELNNFWGEEAVKQIYFVKFVLL